MTQSEALKEADHAFAEIKAAFGAPGDYGYSSPEGKALFTAYKAWASVRSAIAPPGSVDPTEAVDGEMRTVHDPFEGKDVQISDRLVDRLRGKYAMGPHLPNGNPEFGWRQFQAPPIQHEAAARIEELEAKLAALPAPLEEIVEVLTPFARFTDALELLSGPYRCPPGHDFHVLENSQTGRRAISRDDFDRARSLLDRLSNKESSK
jgi:hypothetical protein